jgi:N-acetylglutamate synthase-like GNAT family acetyltransferase
MEIRQANESDLQEIVNLNREFHLNIPNFRWDDSTWIASQIKKKNYFVLNEGNQIWGAECLVEKDSCLYIETIAVKTQMQKKGVGRNLVNFAMKKAKALGYRKLAVDSFFDYKLDDFYKKVGFLKSIKAPEYEGHKYNHYFMFV